MELTYKFLSNIRSPHSTEIIPFNPAFVQTTAHSKILYELTVDSGRILSNKGQHGYYEIYTKIFDPLRNNQLTIVELGIGSIKDSTPSTMYHFHKNLPLKGLQYFPGGSLKLWQKYFRNQNNRYFGWDIDIDDAMIEGASLLTVDTRDIVSTRKTLARTMGSLNNTGESCIDIFIDDGLHTYESQMSVFSTVFPRIRRGGYYIIEDTGVPSQEYDRDTGIFLQSNIKQFLLANEISRICSLRPDMYQFCEYDTPAGMIVVQKP